MQFYNKFSYYNNKLLYAHSRYSDKQYPISYWRTASGIEVDYILGNHQVAIEVKASDNIQTRHLNGLKAFMEEYEVEKSILISFEPYARKVDDIMILPWNIFLSKLWDGEIV